MILKIWKDPVWSMVIATGILALIGAIATYFLGAWPTIKSFSVSIWGFISSSTATPNWLLGIMVIPNLLLGYAILIALKDKLVGSESIRKSYRNYVSDEFLGPALSR